MKKAGLKMYISLNDIKKEVAIHLDRTLTKITKRPGREAATALLSWQRAEEQFVDLTNAVGDLNNKKLLEIGSGYGLFIVICLKNGVRAEGIEPAGQAYFDPTLRFSREILRRAGLEPNLIKSASGESLPYKDNSFDVVVSFFTLEHVKSVKKVLSESTRVLKPGGYLYFVVPNYGSFWEGHYGIIWVPYLPKFLARIYVKFFGKDPSLLSELQLVSQLSLERIIKSLPLEVLEWGEKQFWEKVSTLEFSELNTMASAKKILKILTKFKILKLAVFVANLFKAQTPIVLVAQKSKF